MHGIFDAPRPVFPQPILTFNDAIDDDIAIGGGAYCDVFADYIGKWIKSA